MFELDGETKTHFEEFFEKKKYQKQIKSNSNSIVINLLELAESEPSLALELEIHPKRTIAIIKEIVNKDVLITGIDGFISLRELKSKYIGQLVKVRGLVNQVSAIRPMLMIARFKCRDCGEILPPEPQENPLILEKPIRCNMGADENGKGGCRGRSFDLQPELSTFVDSQEIYIQELLKDIPSGQTPKSVKIMIFSKDLINKVKCGDIVEIIAIVKVKTLTKGMTQTRFTVTYLEALNVTPQNKDPTKTRLSDEDKAQIIELSKDPKIYERMIASVAPNIYGHDNIKESCLYLLFGAKPKKKGNIRVRGDIHVLLLGDPATAKSQFLTTVAELAPRGIYTGGRGASGVGLTAAVLREDNLPMLRGGAMVRADMGVCCIDEIDKMKPEDREQIHTAMEQQIIAINKWGINQKLGTQAAVLAAGNPQYGRWDIHKTVAENMSNLPVTLFSRFDLIWIIKDKPQEDIDRRMAEHMLGLYQDMPKIISPDLFKEYIIYAKGIDIKLTRKTKKYLVDLWVEIRKKSNGEVSITARQLEALERLTEAHARIALKKEADEEDAEAAIRILNASLEQVGIDPTTGKRDIDAWETGKSKTKKDKIAMVIEIINDLDYESHGDGAHINDIIEMAKKKGISREETLRIINKEINSKLCMGRDANYIRIIHQRRLM